MVNHIIFSLINLINSDNYEFCNGIGNHFTWHDDCFRPACRTKKDINSHRVIVSHDCVFLADDYDVGTVGDTFSFEIKVSI